MKPALAFAFTLAAAHAVALPAPIELTHSGYLLDATDRPVTSPALALTFRVFAAAAPVALETPLWTATYTVPVTDGYYTVALGSGATPLPSTLFAYGEPRWLELEVVTSRMAPRMSVGAVPAAGNAARLEGRASAEFVLATDLATSHYTRSQVDGVVGALAPVARTGAWADLTGRPALAAVATSGAWSDLLNRPALAAVATSGAWNDLSGKPAEFPPAAGSSHYLGTAGGTVAALNVNGSVGIGTTAPVAALDVAGTGAIRIPVGTTAQRPSPAALGMLRFNTTTRVLEIYDGLGWSGTGGMFNATGGTTTNVGGYKIHTFTADGTFTAGSMAGNVEVLVVAGGGGGGGRSGATYAVTGGQVLPVTVGGGGTGGPSPTDGLRGGPGGNSVFGTITAFGGGGGGSDDIPAGQNGGSGGGGRYGSAGGTGVSGQGFAGGGSWSNPYAGGGGGGAGGQGIAGTSGGEIGDGGPGAASSISGTLRSYGGGGGGGAHNPANGLGYGGSGGGGNGGAPGGYNNGQAGTPNTGGGGGAGSTISGPGGAGGAGGSGIVIVRYPSPI